MSLTYEIANRPEGVRIIPGETVVFTCEVEAPTLFWRSGVIDGNLTTIVPSLGGDPRMDVSTGK